MVSRFIAVVVGLALLTGCATGRRISAAGDVHALLLSVRDNDRAAFDQYVDRPALEAEIQAAFVNRTRAANLGGSLTTLGVLLSGPLSRAATGMLVKPEVFRAVADYYGYRPQTPIPGPLAIAAALTPLPDGRVCASAKKRGVCLLTFADEDGIWRLVGFDAASALIGPAMGRSR